MEILAVGDIHGRLDLLNKLLFSPEKPLARMAKKIVFLGDYIDRGKDSYKVMKLVTSLPNTILLRGNHEEMSIRRHLYQVWMNNGGDRTLISYEAAGVAPDHFHEAIEAMPLVHREEVGGRLYYFVHGGFSPWERIDRQYEDVISGLSKDTVLWEREHIYNHLDLQWEDNATVVCGHTPLEEAYISDSLCAIDTGAVFDGGKLSALEIGVDGVRLHQVG